MSRAAVAGPAGPAPCGFVTGRSEGQVGRVVAHLLGLVPGERLDARLQVRPAGGGERWTRTFGRRRWSTTCVPTPTGLVEWVGPGQRLRLLGFQFDRVEADASRLRLVAVRLGPVPIRHRLGLMIVVVTGRASTWDVADVSVTLAGRPLVSYRAWVR